MYLVNKMKEVLEKFYICPSLVVDVGDKFKYRIEMENKYINSVGKVVKQQKLVSYFSKEVVSIPIEILALTEIEINKVEFYSSKDAAPLRWTFAEGLKLPNYMYYCNYLDDYQSISHESTTYEGIITNRRNEFESSFSKFPKLYSVYLLIMQAYDILAFDLYTSHILSKPVLFKRMNEIQEIQSMSDTTSFIGMGLYSGESNFVNGDFYAKFLGFNMYKGKLCAVVEYSCDESKVKVIDSKKQFNRVKEGGSYYSGIICLDVETGLAVSATMTENVIAVQYAKEDEKKGTYTRRKVHMTLLSDEEAM